MLTCIRKCFDLIADHKGQRWELATVPQDDERVYDMLCCGESLGVFQVESRAQMNMLPRLKPRTFYDLVIEVAIVRPGPIQGDMVHPYLRRRNGIDKVNYPSPSPEHGDKDELRRVLHKTLGVPLFQEQAMRIAIEAAKFTSEEANGLRRSMATFRNLGTIGKFEDKMIGNMIARGYDPEFAKNCFNQIKGFGSYGFPESHAASFAQLVYISSWLKHYHPDAFCCGLLNSQPMGFYAPAQIVGDARTNGVEVREIDVSFSFAQNTLEQGEGEYCAVRLGFRQIDGFHWVDPDEEELKRSQALLREGTALPLPLAGEGWGGGVSASHTLRGERAPTRIASCDAMRPKSELRSSRPPQAGEVKTDWADRIIAARQRRPFTSLEDFARDTGLPKRALILLADADAFRSIGLDRRAALWAVRRLPDDVPLPLFEVATAREQPDENAKPLPEMPLPEQVVADYQTMRLSLKGHPMEFLRAMFTRERVVACTDVCHRNDKRRVRCAGVVLVRQRPGSANGVVFMTLEDETGIANIVVWPQVMEQYRKEVMGARLILVEGYIQSSPEQVTHLVAQRMFDRSHDLISLANDALSRKHPVPAGPALIEPLNDDRRDHPETSAQKIRHPRDVRILPPSRDFH
jgi:error-prone DNA polymerase